MVHQELLILICFHCYRHEHHLVGHHTFALLFFHIERFFMFISYSLQFGLDPS